MVGPYIVYTMMGVIQCPIFICVSPRARDDLSCWYMLKHQLMINGSTCSTIKPFVLFKIRLSCYQQFRSRRAVKRTHLRRHSFSAGYLLLLLFLPPAPVRGA